MEYVEACEQLNLQAAAYTTFCAKWTELVPFITVMRPMSDLCHLCQENSTLIMRSANSPEEQKSKVSMHMWIVDWGGGGGETITKHYRIQVTYLVIVRGSYAHVDHWLESENQS